MHLVKDACSLLLKRLINLSTVAVSVVRAEPASSDISQVWNIPGQKGQNCERKASLKIKKKIPFSNYSASVLCPGTEAGPAWACVCLCPRNAILAVTEEPPVVLVDPAATLCPYPCAGSPQVGEAEEILSKERILVPQVLHCHMDLMSVCGRT